MFLIFNELGQLEDEILRRRREREEGLKTQDANRKRMVETKSFSLEHLRVRIDFIAHAHASQCEPPSPTLT
jgi:hypothetical protein